MTIKTTTTTRSGIRRSASSPLSLLAQCWHSRSRHGSRLPQQDKTKNLPKKVKLPPDQKACQLCRSNNCEVTSQTFMPRLMRARSLLTMPASTSSGHSSAMGPLRPQSGPCAPISRSNKPIHARNLSSASLTFMLRQMLARSVLTMPVSISPGPICRERPQTGSTTRLWLTAGSGQWETELIWPAVEKLRSQRVLAAGHSTPIAPFTPDVVSGVKGFCPRWLTANSSETSPLDATRTYQPQN